MNNEEVLILRQLLYHTFEADGTMKLWNYKNIYVSSNLKAIGKSRS
jgi:hypothetical protein